MAYTHPNAGGFILSPPPSSRASSTTSAKAQLPHPRNAPLRPGGSKESALIRYADSKVLEIQRRFAKRTTFSTNTLVDGAKPPTSTSWADVIGYTSMRQACKDIDELVNMIWISGTPSLQVPYLLNLALLLATVVGGMPPSPRKLFELLGKLDRAFASLLLGRDVETGETLPGFDGRRGVSGTEKVRIRSLVERTRVSIMEAFKRAEFEYEEPEEDDPDTNVMNSYPDHELIVEGEDEEDANSDMQLARVYDLTIVELGDSLAAPDIGIITEGRTFDQAQRGPISAMSMSEGV